MKITKSQLRQIIQEELSKVLQEGVPQGDFPNYPGKFGPLGPGLGHPKDRSQEETATMELPSKIQIEDPFVPLPAKKGGVVPRLSALETTVAGIKSVVDELRDLVNRLVARPELSPVSEEKVK